MRLAGRVALLVALWLLAWGDITLANLLSGLAVAGALLVAFPLAPSKGATARFHPLGFAKLAAWVAVQLVVSNIVMTREILRHRPQAHPGVVAHRLTWPSEQTVTLMTSVIALSPGTMTVDADADSSTIYVHFYDLRDIARARATLERLERLAVGVIGPQHNIPNLATDKEQP
jgi:multicomponent Na+:H+ antiporter subunit E